MIPQKFQINGVGYVVNGQGAICQDDMAATQAYTREYVEKRYCSIPETVRQMSMLRAGFILGKLGRIHSLVDVGYGSGDFLMTMRLWASWWLNLYGVDISGYPVPEGCKKVNMGELGGKLRFDVACFFDSLEHIPNLDFLGRIRADHLVVTVPWCHANLGLDWFRSWKHRRPGEHLWHFTPLSLSKTLLLYGYECIGYESIEDAIRQPIDNNANTFTAVFRKQ